MTAPPLADGKRRDLKMTLVLGGAVVAAIGLSVYSSSATHNTPLRSEDPASVATQPTQQPAQADPTPAVDDSALNGDVLEALPVAKYTYLRLHTRDGEVWAAVPSAAIAVGAHVAIANATRMDDFKSTTLERTFNVIYFGTLAAAPAAAASAKFSVLDTPALDDDSTLPAGHPDIGSAAPLGSVADSDPLPPGHPDIQATSAPALAGEGTSPHHAADGNANGPPLPELRVEPARGNNAYVISALSAQRQKLAGHRVRLRAQVTKVTPDVNGRAFFHLRDGNAVVGSTERAPDLVATAVVPPQRGEVAIFEGTLRADVDVGIGYKYPVLLEDATIVGQ
jgi:hypothetical protein